MNEDQHDDAGFRWPFTVGAGLIMLLVVAFAVVLLFALLGLRLPWF